MKLPIPFTISLLMTVFYSCEETGNQIIDLQPTSGVVFEKSIGGQLDDIAYESIIHNDELYILGSTKSYGELNGDHYLIKMDLEGNLLEKEEILEVSGKNRMSSLLPAFNNPFFYSKDKKFFKRIF